MAGIDPQLAAFLEDIFESGRSHDQDEPQHCRRFLNLEPETAVLLSILTRSSSRTSVLEIGTSNGYSTLWLAWAVVERVGQVTTIERDAAKQKLAHENLQRAGLRERVELLLGDATEIVAQLPGPFDMVFFDADRISAPRQLELLLPKLAPDVLLLADNAISHPDEVAAYLALVKTLPGFVHLVVPVGKGLSVAYRSGKAL